MNLTKWDPMRELEEMSNRLNRFFHVGPPATPAMPNTQMFMRTAWAPLVDIKETPEEYLVRTELPGMNKEEIKVTSKDGVLTIQGERKQEKEEKNEKFHRIERSYGSFFRSFSLPDGVDAQKLAASYKDGVLTVHLPKSPTAKPSVTEVKIA